MNFRKKWSTAIGEPVSRVESRPSISAHPTVFGHDRSAIFVAMLTSIPRAVFASGSKCILRGIVCSAAVHMKMIARALETCLVPHSACREASFPRRRVFVAQGALGFQIRSGRRQRRLQTCDDQRIESPGESGARRVSAQICDALRPLSASRLIPIMRSVPPAGYSSIRARTSLPYASLSTDLRNSMSAPSIALPRKIKDRSGKRWSVRVIG